MIIGAGSDLVISFHAQLRKPFIHEGKKTHAHESAKGSAEAAPINTSFTDSPTKSNPVSTRHVLVERYQAGDPFILLSFGSLIKLDSKESGTIYVAKFGTTRLEGSSSFHGLCLYAACNNLEVDVYNEMENINPNNVYAPICFSDESNRPKTHKEPNHLSLCAIQNMSICQDFGPHRTR